LERDDKWSNPGPETLLRARFLCSQEVRVTTLRKPAKFAGLASVALAATSATVLFASQAAFATTPGDNGTVKVHDSTTPVTDYQNDPQDVCQFYLDGFGFDGAQSVTWYIDSWPPTGNGTEVLNGSLTMDANGDGYTANQSLPNGHYKLFWNFTGENGAAKQKVFWVKCPGAEPTPTSTTPDGTPTSPSPTCTCASTPPTSTPPTTPPALPTQTPPVPAAPAPVAVTGSLPVTG
jgi:hypothetical protein